MPFEWTFYQEMLNQTSCVIFKYENTIQNKTRIVKEFVYELIRPSILKSSWLYCCVKVRKVTKSVCKGNTKGVRWNEVTQHTKKYLLNCSVKVYQRIMKLKYRASRFLQMFCCNRPTSLYESQTDVWEYCKFQLSADGCRCREKPGCYLYIDPCKTVAVQYCQTNDLELVFRQNL